MYVQVTPWWPLTYRPNVEIRTYLYVQYVQPVQYSTAQCVRTYVLYRLYGYGSQGGPLRQQALLQQALLAAAL